MGFKLGTERGLEATNGEIRTKMRFGQQAGGDASVPGTPVIRTKLEPGVVGEANMDGSIFISDKVEPESKQEEHVLMHEMVHQTDMKLGKLAYDDNFIKWNGEIYDRKNGKIFYNNEWYPEGSKDFPWEKMPWE